MLRASQIKPAGTWPSSEAIDRVALDADQRQRRRMMVTGEKGTQVLLDLPHATMLRDGDGLLLEAGAIVHITAKPEPLLEVEAPSADALARLAWHLGNRHTEVEVAGERLRLRRDHVLAEMLVRLGAQVNEVEAPFNPEPGAYEGGKHSHQHTHDR